MFRISELRNKDIINSVDGKRLGYIKDVELDLQNGRISALILPSGRSFMSLFARDNDIIVQWTQIQKIGIDVIIVELPGFTPLGPYEQAEYREREEARRLLRSE